MAVTMQQVAELAGVSRGTVDRVLHGRPNVDAVVREKVLRAAEKLGYSCKKTASAPRHRAAILIPQWTDTYFNRQVISGIRRALRYIADDSFELLEVPLRTMTSQELVGAIGQQVENGVDGLIVRAENTPEVYLAIRQALESGIRVITYDGDIPDSGRACFVGQDLMRAGAIAAGVMAIPMGIRDCLLTGPRTGRHRKKSYRAGPWLPPDRGETGARRNIPAGFCNRGGLRI